MNVAESTSDSTAPANPETDDYTLEAACDRLNELTEHLAELETEVERKDERSGELKGTFERRDALRDQYRLVRLGSETASIHRSLVANGILSSTHGM